MRTNVIQFLAIVASVFIVLSLLKMLSDSTEPVQNIGEVRANFTDATEEQPVGYLNDSYEAPADIQEDVPEQVQVQRVVEPEPESVGSSGNCFPKDSLTAKDLLPSDDSSNKWAQVNPVGKGDIQDQNFVVAGHHIGVNTVGQSLRNANRQLRSEPANPQVKVSPWNQATIDPDVNRKGLEIGGC
jgi:hypothetical protein